jgi:hypothetical protein
MQEVDVKNVPSSSSMKKFSLDDALMGSKHSCHEKIIIISIE